jgi:hypothetical protein
VKPVRSAYQPPASSTFLSERTSNQPQPASSTLLSEQTSTSHQPPANRTGSFLVNYDVPMQNLAKYYLGSSWTVLVNQTLQPKKLLWHHKFSVTSCFTFELTKNTAPEEQLCAQQS